MEIASTHALGLAKYLIKAIALAAPQAVIGKWAKRSNELYRIVLGPKLGKSFIQIRKLFEGVVAFEACALCNNPRLASLLHDIDE